MADESEHKELLLPLCKDCGYFPRVPHSKGKNAKGKPVDYWECQLHHILVTDECNTCSDGTNVKGFWERKCGIFR